MYNTNFKVKYHDIEQELVYKNNAVNTEAGADHNDVYSLEDIQIVCDKLYKDELTSVFYAEDILDDKIDEGIKHVIKKMSENNDFKIIVDKLKEELKTQFNPVELQVDEQSIDYRNNIDLLVYLTLFSKEHFHLTHKCICQQLNNGHIDNHLLEDLSQIVMLKNTEYV
jgi:hypothetical protein